MTLDEFVQYIIDHPNDIFCDGVKGHQIRAVNTSLGFAYFRHVHRINPGLEVWIKAPGSANGLYRDVPDRPDRLVIITGGSRPAGWHLYPDQGIQVEEGILKLDSKYTPCVFVAQDGTTINFHMAYLA